MKPEPLAELAKLPWFSAPTSEPVNPWELMGAALGALTQRLRAKGYAVSLPAWLTHELLCLGLDGSDLVTVEYRPHLQVFEVGYWDLTQTFEWKRRACDLDGAESLVDALAGNLSGQVRPRVE